MEADEGRDETTVKPSQLESSSERHATSATKEGTDSSQPEHTAQSAVQDKKIDTLDPGMEHSVANRALQLCRTRIVSLGHDMLDTNYENQTDLLELQTSLETTVTRLRAQITETESLLDETREKLRAATSPDQGDPAAIVKRHIHLLHEYNEIKDIGQGLMGLIADARGARHVDVQTEFGIGSKD